MFGLGEYERNGHVYLANTTGNYNAAFAGYLGSRINDVASWLPMSRFSPAFYSQMNPGKPATYIKNGLLMMDLPQTRTASTSRNTVTIDSLALLHNLTREHATKIVALDKTPYIAMPLAG